MFGTNKKANFAMGNKDKLKNPMKLTTSIADHEAVTMTKVELFALLFTVHGSSLGLRDEQETVGWVRGLNETSLDGGLTHDTLGSISPHGGDGKTVLDVLRVNHASGAVLDDFVDGMGMDGTEVVTDGGLGVDCARQGGQVRSQVVVKEQLELLQQIQIAGVGGEHGGLRGVSPRLHPVILLAVGTDCGHLSVQVCLVGPREINPKHGQGGIQILVRDKNIISIDLGAFHILSHTHTRHTEMSLTYQVVISRTSPLVLNAYATPEKVVPKDGFRL